MRFLFLFLLIPSLLFAQHSPRFEGIRKPDEWKLLGEGSDNIAKTSDYILPSTIKSKTFFRMVVSKLVISKKDSVIEQTSLMMYNCRDSTFSILKGIKSVNNTVVHVVDFTEYDNLRWSKVRSNSPSGKEFNYLCR